MSHPTTERSAASSASSASTPAEPDATALVHAAVRGALIDAWVAFEHGTARDPQLYPEDWEDRLLARADALGLALEGPASRYTVGDLAQALRALVSAPDGSPLGERLGLPAHTSPWVVRRAAVVILDELCLRVPVEAWPIEV